MGTGDMNWMGHVCDPPLIPDLYLCLHFCIPVEVHHLLKSSETLCLYIKILVGLSSFPIKWSLQTELKSSLIRFDSSVSALLENV